MSNNLSESDVQRIGELLRSARTATGATQHEAAQWVGVSDQTISNWENARGENPLLQLVYLRHLLSQSDEAQPPVLELVGANTNPSLVPEGQLSVEIVVRGMASPTIRPLLKTLEMIVDGSSEGRTR